MSVYKLCELKNNGRPPLNQYLCLSGQAKGPMTAKAAGLDITKLTGILAFKDDSEEQTFTTTINGKQVTGVVRGDGKGTDVIYLGTDKKYAIVVPSSCCGASLTKGKADAMG
eukprot:scaffold28172_cov41-Prasinocladus_malaysianus.AAC.1